MKSYGKISIIAPVAIGIAAMMIPGGSLVSRAFADGVSGGSASADFNTQSNSASNTATVHIHNGGHHGKISDSGNVHQDFSQSNSIVSSNSGGGSASADFNTQINTAINTADVHIHNHGGKISHSGNVDQSVTQSNSISANNTHSGLGGCSFLDPRC
jgi:hypothetical protein